MCKGCFCTQVIIRFSVTAIFNRTYYVRGSITWLERRLRACVVQNVTGSIPVLLKSFYQYYLLLLYSVLVIRTTYWPMVMDRIRNERLANIKKIKLLHRGRACFKTLLRVKRHLLFCEALDLRITKMLIFVRVFLVTETRFMLDIKSEHIFRAIFLSVESSVLSLVIDIKGNESIIVLLILIYDLVKTILPYVNTVSKFIFLK